MATYSGEEYSLMTVANMSPNCWDGRWEFSLSEISSGRYAYSISIYLRLVPGKRASNYRNTWGDYATAHYEFYIPEVGVNEVTYGPYRVVGGQGWTKYLATISGEFTVSGKTTIRPGFGVMSGYGSSEGTVLYAVDTWWCGCGEYEVIGIKPADPSNPRCTAKTSSSITMTFDIDWGNEPENGTRDPACTLLDSNHNEIRVIRNGTSTGTFTGLSRYTPYYIRGYACNSQGGGYTNEVLVYTNPENPTISKPVISNLGRLTATVTPGKVTDDGGKAITEIETYIKGGAYGDTLTSIGKGSGAKNLTGLQPNTTYKVITRATNGITESYSAYETFTTLGNPPTITDVYASTVSTTGATITYTATYDHNAKFSQYKIQWRYPGSTTWTDVSISNNKITGVSNLNTDVIEYRITVTDNWSRSTTSKVLTYVMEENLDDTVSSISITKNSNDTYTLRAIWTQKLYNKIKYANILCEEEGQQTYEKVGEPVINSTGITVTTKQYKNKLTKKNILLTISYSCNTMSILRFASINPDKVSSAINIIKSSGTTHHQFSSIVKDENGETNLKILRSHDIVKLSRKMRYIQIDSKGTYDNYTNDTGFVSTCGRFTINIKANLRHISQTLYKLEITNLQIKTNDNSKIRIRNRNLLLTLTLKSHSKPVNYSLSWFLPDITVTNSWLTLDSSNYNNYLEINDSYNANIGLAFELKNYSSFDYQNTISSNLSNNDINKTAANSDILNNSICKIQVFDNNNNNIALNKTIKLTDGSSPIVYNGGNATDNSAVNSDKFIYSNNGLPLLLDLGQEYIISKIKIWRRNSSNSEYKYSRNYIHGRNKDNELCYIFFDSNRDLQYQELSSGKEFRIN